jgi:phage baseplate assembly protein W
MAIDFYGRGFSWPMRLSTKGGLAESSNLQKIHESLHIVLGTQYGERVMRPTFGCNLKSLVFSPNNASTAALARHYVQDGLKQWEPRIDVQDVTVTNNNTQGLLLIEIRYRIKATLQADSLVYPFYLEQT